MSKGPDRIWLQWEGEYHEETTWCVDPIDDDDIGYIKVDIADRRLALLRRLEWPFEFNQCGICDESIYDGHADDCELAEELKD